MNPKEDPFCDLKKVVAAHKPKNITEQGHCSRGMGYQKLCQKLVSLVCSRSQQ